jgi:hypothetical protein
MPNIKPEREFNPFPREGLVKAFEPFIRKEVNRYSEAYPHVPRMDLLIEAVRLATQAEVAFKPALGTAFRLMSPTGSGSYIASPRAIPACGSRRKAPKRRLYASLWNAAGTRGRSLSEEVTPRDWFSTGSGRSAVGMRSMIAFALSSVCRPMLQ